MKELQYGPVIIVSGPNKGKWGLYDDDNPGKRKNSAIVYLPFESKWHSLNPDNLMNFDANGVKFEVFKCTMGYSVGYRPENKGANAKVKEVAEYLGYKGN